MTAVAAEPPSPKTSGNWMVPAIIGGSLLLITLNTTVVYNALPAMAVALHEDLLHLNLVLTMFMLASTVFMPLSSWLADRFGAKKVLLSAVALFAASSVACGLSQTLTEMILARVIQGAAGAMMVPVGRLILLRTTPKSELIGAMAILAMPAMLGPAIGPVLGGAIVTFADWRWVFFMNIPVALIGGLLVYAYVPPVPRQETAAVDWLGIALTTVGLGALVFGVESLARSVVSLTVVVAMFVVAAACLGAYWGHARGRPEAIIDLTLFRVNTYNASVAGGAALRLSIGAVPFLLAMLLQVGFGMSAWSAGLMTFMSAAGGLVMKQAAPPILRRFGFRKTLMVNAVLVAVSFASYFFFTASTPHWLILGLLGIGGFFRTLQLTTLTGLAFADLEQQQMSRGSATLSMSQQLLQAIGVGMAAITLQLTMQIQGRDTLTAAAVSPSFLIVGLVSLVSILWFIKLPRDAGDEMNGRGPSADRER